MADKKPIRAVFNDEGVATGLAEFQSTDTVGLAHGGLGASLSLGTAGQVLKVNSGASALEFGVVEAIVNIDGATNLTSNTNTTRLNGVRISEGGVSQLVNSNTTSVTIQNTQNNNRNTGYIYWNTTSSSTAFTYSFTNNTGYPVVISGSGITTTTIPDGGTNNEAIANPNGNFTIQYEVANAQAKNGNIPTGGAISFTDFYGTEDFS